MTEQENKQTGKKKGFFGRLIEKLDKKMEEKANKGSCCGGANKDKGSSCC